MHTPWCHVQYARTVAQMSPSHPGMAKLTCKCYATPTCDSTHASASVQVSCGTFHTCAVSAGGRLFSWGDGLCGKLGQGHLHTCPEPRQVSSLADQTVLHVACGMWHTACIARPRQSQDKVGSVSYLEGPLSGSLSLEDSSGERCSACSTLKAFRAYAHSMQLSVSNLRCCIHPQFLEAHNAKQLKDIHTDLTINGEISAC